MTFSIIPGWAEGPWQTKRLATKLFAEGLERSKDVSKADIVISHSSGCYWLPSFNKAKLIVLIGPAYWPGKSRAVSAMQEQFAGTLEAQSEKHLLWWIRKLVKNGWYILSRPISHYRLLTRNGIDFLPKTNSKVKVVLIRNINDRFCHPEIRLIATKFGYKYTELPGGHDDCWINPGAYVDIIKAWLK